MKQMQEIEFTKYPDLQEIFEKSSTKSVAALKSAWIKYVEDNYSTYKTMLDISASMDRYGKEKTDTSTVIGKLFSRFVNEIIDWQKAQNK